MTINPSKFFEYLEYKLYGSHPPLTEIFQIQKYASNKEDMISMDNSLLNLYKAGRITKETALEYATNPEMLKRKL